MESMARGDKYFQQMSQQRPGRRPVISSISSANLTHRFHQNTAIKLLLHIFLYVTLFANFLILHSHQFYVYFRCSLQLRFYCNSTNRGFKTKTLKIKCKCIGGSGYFGGPTSMLGVLFGWHFKTYIHVPPYSENMPNLLFFQAQFNSLSI